MRRKANSNTLFCNYFEKWIEDCKVGAVTEVTLKKWMMALSWVKRLAPDLTLAGLNRRSYQDLMNAYAETHARQTTLDFHTHLKGCILDAKDMGDIDRDPTMRVTFRGQIPVKSKPKFMSRDELTKLLRVLPLESDVVGYDWLILVLAKTGLRFAEGLGITPADIDFDKQAISINKTWNYKIAPYGFAPTKNLSSLRDVTIDPILCYQLKNLVKDLPEDEPVFVDTSKPIYNATVLDSLTRWCIEAEVPVISIHGLRHTHASLLLEAGVSILSVSKRLGHSNVSTTQNVYLHITQELERADRAKANDVMTRLLN